MSDQAWGHFGPDLLILGPNELERYQRLFAKVCRKDRRMIDHECPECGEPLLSVVQGEELTAEITGPLTGAPADGWVCPECGVFFAEGTVEGYVALAKTALEESAMWATKSIVFERDNDPNAERK